MGTTRTAMYRLYNASDELLYVGISSNPEGRWKAHRWGPDRMPWINEVGRRTVEWLESRPLALDAEAKAIKAERPKYNGKHNYNDAPFDPATWPTVTAKHKVPAIADLIRAEIAAGRWSDGQRIPSLRALADAASVSKSIVSKASSTLQEAGILTFRSGHGLFVSRAAQGRPKLPHDWPRTFGFPG